MNSASSGGVLLYASITDLCYLEVRGNRMYLCVEIRRYVRIGGLGIARVIRSKMRWPVFVARITAMLHNVLVGNPESN